MDRLKALRIFEKHGYQIDAGEKIGRDPREMDISDLNALGHEKMPMLKVIRAKCLDCCVGQAGEVRKCTAFRCPLWPYRMGKTPFSEREANPAALAAMQKKAKADAT